MDWAALRTYFNYSPVRKDVVHMKVNYDLMNGVIHMEDVAAIINPGNISTAFLPDKIQHYPIINSKINTLRGEEAARVFDWRVIVTNPNSVSQIEEDKKAEFDSIIAGAVENTEINDEQAQKEVQDGREYINYTWQDIREILRVGVPAGIQGMVFNLSNMVIQSAINSEGALAMAASAAGYVLEINSYPFIIAFGQAITTFTSQNFGAGNLKRCRDVLRRGLQLNFLFTCVIIWLVFLLVRPFLSIFGLNEEAMELGVMRIHIIIGFYFLSTVYESLSASMRGFGNSMGPALAMLVSIVGTRLLWLATVYKAVPTYRNIMYCYPLSWLAADILIGALFWRELRKGKMF